MRQRPGRWGISESRLGVSANAVGSTTQTPLQPLKAVNLYDARRTDCGPTIVD